MGSPFGTVENHDDEVDNVYHMDVSQRLIIALNTRYDEYTKK